MREAGNAVSRRDFLAGVTAVSVAGNAWGLGAGAPWAVACGIAAGLGILALGGTTEFLYFQF